MEIRAATTADIDSIAALNVDVQNLHAVALPHIFKTVSDGAFARAYIVECLTDPNSHFFVASLDGEDIGYVYARIVRRSETPYTHARELIYIDQISVKPEYQGKGCGALLIQAVRDLARQHGIDTIALDFWAFNDKARTFFARQGFATYNERAWMRLE